MFNELKNVKTMKKKQILFLFAASALFAACSSDEMPTNNGSNEQGGGEETTEVYASSYSATTNEGIGVTIGDLSASETDTRTTSTTDEVSFTIILPDDLLREQDESYVLAADDFAIRYDGKYLDIERVEGSTSLSDTKVEISRNGTLGIKIDGLQNIEYSGEDRHEVTFEAYLWIENQKEEMTGNGVTFVERFSWADKLAWIGIDPEGGYTITADTERGWDGTKWVANNNGAKLSSAAYNDDQPPYGYGVRYNVYQGLQGTPYNEAGEQDDDGGLGNTPYFKISVHVNRLADDVETQIVPVIPD